MLQMYFEGSALTEIRLFILLPIFDIAKGE